MAESFSDRMMQLMGSGVFEGHDGGKVLQDSVGNKLVLSADDLRLIELAKDNLTYLTNESHIGGITKIVSSEEKWKELEREMEILANTVRFVDEESKRNGEEEKVKEREKILKERIVQIENLREGYKYRQKNHLPGLGEQVANVRRLITSGQDFSKELHVLSKQKDAGEDIQRLKNIRQICEELDQMGQVKNLDVTEENIEVMANKLDKKSTDESRRELEAGLEESRSIFNQIIQMQLNIQNVEKSGFEAAKRLAGDYKYKVGTDGVPTKFRERANRVRQSIGREMVKQMEVRMDGGWGNDLVGLRVDYGAREKHTGEIESWIATNNIGDAVKISMKQVMKTVGMDPKEWEAGVITEVELTKRQEEEKQQEIRLTKEIEKKNKAGLFDFISSVKEKREEEVVGLQRELGASRDRIKRFGWQKDVLFELGFGKEFLKVLKEEKTPRSDERGV